MELVSGLAVPAVVLIAAVIMLFSRLSGGDGTGIFASGARRGFESAVSLLPMLVLLNMTVSLFSASGLADALAAAFAPLAEMLGVPSEILPLIMHVRCPEAPQRLFLRRLQPISVPTASRRCAPP